MKFATTAAIFGAMSTAVSGLVLELCKDINFKSCENFDGILSNNCYNVVTGWNDNISSLRVITDGFKCYFYQDGNCAGPQGGPAFTNGDYADLRNWPGWNDAISSYKCVKV